MTLRSVNLFMTYKGEKHNAQKFELSLKTGLLHVSDWGIMRSGIVARRKVMDS
jgi:hypothetical protein